MSIPKELAFADVLFEDISYAIIVWYSKLAHQSDLTSPQSWYVSILALAALSRDDLHI